MISELYKSDLMVEIMHIEEAIEFEKAMRPLKLMLLFATVASSLMLLYMLAKKYL
jgi:hypothetical protein